MPQPAPPPSIGHGGFGRTWGGGGVGIGLSAPLGGDGAADTGFNANAALFDGARQAGLFPS